MDSLYSRYASALFSIALEENQVDFYRKEIKVIRKIFLENEDLIHLFSSYFIDDKEKNDVVDKIFSNENINIVNFIKIIIHNKRTISIIKIFDEFIKDCNQHLKIKDGIIYSVNELNQKQIKDLEKAIEAKLNYQVELINVIDKKLIGGFKIQVEDQIFDGSIKNRLENLRNSLISGGN